MRQLVVFVFVAGLSARALAEEAPGPAAPAVPPEATSDRAPPEMTLLRVRSLPSGAEVVVDGHGCDRAPALIEVAPGPHVVEVFDGDRRLRITTVAVEGETVEVRADLSTTAPARPSSSTGPLVAQRRDREPASVVEPEAEPRERWSRRVPRWSWLELALEPGLFVRTFSVDVDPTIDPYGRALYALDSGPVGLLGFHVGLYPFVGSGRRAVRGLGLEAGYRAALGMRILSAHWEDEVESSYYEVDIGVVYALAFGAEDLGATLALRLGWHRTDFYLGGDGNDSIPPFVYDTVRIAAGLDVPLGTRHVIGRVGLGYLPVGGVGAAAAAAYNASGQSPSANGVETSVGLAFRFGSLDLSVRWVGRWLISENRGLGRGYGTYPTTLLGLGGNGIETESAASDSYQQLLFGIGYRL